MRLAARSSRARWRWLAAITLRAMPKSQATGRPRLGR
jgi:hypothetical protein